MLEALFKTLLAVIMLVIIVPLVLLLFGEGALACKVFGWAFPKNERQEMVAYRSDNNEVEQATAIKQVLMNHNTYEDGKKGMTITVEFDSKNLMGESLYCFARFYNEDGSPLEQKHYNEKYRTVNGDVIVGQFTSPSNNDCSIKTTLFMPYDELPIEGTGRTNLLLDANVFHCLPTQCVVMDQSDSYPFYLLIEP